MVSTRNHPRQFPPPDLSPTKASPSKSPTKRSTRSSSSMVKEETPEHEEQQAIVPRRARAPSISTTWSHTPSQITLFWMLISLPLVIWDTMYMLGRPHTMPGGKWHAPLWKPYALYGTVDYVYGFTHYEEHGGWGPAQAFANSIETAMYLLYVWIAFKYGKEESIAGRGAPTSRLSLGRRKIVGREAGMAVLLGFTTAIMTWWKTFLYWFIEYFNGYQSIGHNDLWSLVVLWIIPNGAWLIGSGYLIYVFGSEILQGLEIAAGLPRSRKDV